MPRASSSQVAVVAVAALCNPLDRPASIARPPMQTGRRCFARTSTPGNSRLRLLPRSERISTSQCWALSAVGLGGNRAASRATPGVWPSQEPTIRLLALRREQELDTVTEALKTARESLSNASDRHKAATALHKRVTNLSKVASKALDTHSKIAADATLAAVI